MDGPEPASADDFDEWVPWSARECARMRGRLREIGPAEARARDAGVIALRLVEWELSVPDEGAPEYVETVLAAVDARSLPAVLRVRLLHVAAEAVRRVGVAARGAVLARIADEAAALARAGEHEMATCVRAVAVVAARTQGVEWDCPEAFERLLACACDALDAAPTCRGAEMTCCLVALAIQGCSPAAVERELRARAARSMFAALRGEIARAEADAGAGAEADAEPGVCTPLVGVLRCILNVIESNPESRADFAACDIGGDDADEPATAALLRSRDTEAYDLTCILVCYLHEELGALAILQEARRAVALAAAAVGRDPAPVFRQHLGDDAITDEDAALDAFVVRCTIMRHNALLCAGAGARAEADRAWAFMAARGGAGGPFELFRGLLAEEIAALPLDALGAGGECAVCIADVAAGELLRELPCGHRFHAACVDAWLAERATCPLCRRALCARPTDPDS